MGNYKRHNPIEENGLRCSKCGTVQSTNEFPRSKRRRSGYGGWCKKCTKKFRKVSVEKARGYSKKHYIKNQIKISQYRKKYREEHRADLRKWRVERGYAIKEKNQKLRSAYGISIDEYNVILKAQGGGCAVCGKNPEKRMLSVDHNHSTGKIRGLLCRGCNVGIGNLGDDPVILLKAINYLIQ